MGMKREYVELLIVRGTLLDLPCLRVDFLELGADHFDSWVGGLLLEKVGWRYSMCIQTIMCWDDMVEDLDADGIERWRGEMDD
jgi:phage pi2 protein 07